jgi:hypothetical protein
MLFGRVHFAPMRGRSPCSAGGGVGIAGERGVGFTWCRHDDLAVDGARDVPSMAGLLYLLLRGEHLVTFINIVLAVMALVVLYMGVKVLLNRPGA